MEPIGLSPGILSRPGFITRKRRWPVPTDPPESTPSWCADCDAHHKLRVVTGGLEEALRVIIRLQADLEDAQCRIRHLEIWRDAVLDIERGDLT